MTGDAEEATLPVMLGCERCWLLMKRGLGDEEVPGDEAVFPGDAEMRGALFGWAAAQTGGGHTSRSGEERGGVLCLSEGREPGQSAGAAASILT
mmetsp:Transcript_22425/g.45364  ORF Transcript_22425/g.45364 Transcript_22425/m.45364 type:complete len:94 (+) Transcript_22425:259-540(+)